VAYVGEDLPLTVAGAATGSALPPHRVPCHVLAHVTFTDTRVYEDTQNPLSMVTASATCAANVPRCIKATEEGEARSTSADDSLGT